MKISHVEKDTQLKENPTRAVYRRRGVALEWQDHSKNELWRLFTSLCSGAASPPGTSNSDLVQADSDMP